ncbi:MAG: hypothetical protein RI988_2773 [Pseudomonadota bacterium]
MTPMTRKGLRRPKRVRRRSLEAPMKGSTKMSTIRASIMAVPRAASDRPISPA